MSVQEMTLKAITCFTEKAQCSAHLQPLFDIAVPGLFPGAAFKKTVGGV